MQICIHIKRGNDQGSTILTINVDDYITVNNKVAHFHKSKIICNENSKYLMKVKFII